MRLAFIVAGVCALAVGCATTSEWSRMSKVNRYLKDNPGITEETAAALRSKTLLKGMSKQEVVLCLGAPTRTEVVKGSDAGHWVWYYADRDENGLPVADNTIVAVLLARGPAGSAVATWLTRKDFDEPDHAAPPVVEIPLSPPISPPSTQPPVAPATPAFTGPSGTLVPDGWPDIKLGGVLKQGDNSVVIINGKFFSKGDAVDGVTVVAIMPDGVLLERQGSQYLLKNENLKR